jgi:predicted nucleic acid-binding protein
VRVVDASVVTDFLLGRPTALDAFARRTAATGPHLDVRRADEAVADLADLRLVRYPHAPLRPRVWELRDSLTAYDATYVALAEALGDAVLLTGDRGLAAQARATLGADRVRHIS